MGPIHPVHHALDLDRLLGNCMVDPKGSGLLFFMFRRAHPYTCLGIEWVLCLALTSPCRAGSQLAACGYCRFSAGMLKTVLRQPSWFVDLRKIYRRLSCSWAKSHLIGSRWMASSAVPCLRDAPSN